jgi:hypothetical protein
MLLAASELVFAEMDSREPRVGVGARRFATGPRRCGVRVSGRADDVGGPGELAVFIGEDEVVIRRDSEFNKFAIIT